jgi:hypothetical protein
MVLMETGGFQNGGADHSGPNYFMDEKIVLVTFNYRFLNTKCIDSCCIYVVVYI